MQCYTSCLLFRGKYDLPLPWSWLAHQDTWSSHHRKIFIFRECPLRCVPLYATSTCTRWKFHQSARSASSVAWWILDWNALHYQDWLEKISSGHSTPKRRAYLEQWHLYKLVMGCLYFQALQSPLTLLITILTLTLASLSLHVPFSYSNAH